MPWTPGSGGSSSGTPAPKAPKAPGSEDVSKSVLRLAGRLASRDKNFGPDTQFKLQSTLKGLSPRQIKSVGKQVGLPSRVTKYLVNPGNTEGGSEFSTGVGELLTVANAPGQAVLGGITEGPSGAWKGFSSQKDYTPVRAFVQGIQGKSEAQARQAEKDLGGWATPINIAGSVVTDPLTALSFGTSAAGKAAATRAAELSGVAEATVLRRGAKAFTKEGLKDLGKAQAKAVAESGGGKLAQSLGGRRLVRAVKGAPGGVKLGGKTILNTRGITDNLAGRAARVPLGKLTAPIETAFRNESGVRLAAREGEDWAKGVADQLSSVLAKSRGRTSAATDEAFAATKRALQSNKVTSRDYDVIRDALDVGGDAAKLTAKQMKAHDDLRAILDETIGAERVAGVPTPYLGQGSVKALEGEIEKRAGNPILNAIRRMQDPTIKDPLFEAAQAQETALARQYVPHYALGKNPERRGGGLFSTADPSFTKHRQIEGSISDINKYAETHPGATRMETNLPKIVVRRQLDSARAVNKQQTLDDLLGIAGGDGKPVFKDASEHLQAPRGMVEVSVPGHGPDAQPYKFWAPPELKSDIERHFENLASDQTVEQLTNLFDRYNRFWKRWAVATPGFISRNVQSNLYAASFLPERGFRASMVDYGRAAKIQKAAEKGLDEVGDAFKFLGPRDAAAYKAAQDSGALQGTFTPADIATRTTVKSRLRDEVRAGNVKEVGKRTARTANPLGPDFPLTASLRKANSALENNARLALFLHNQKTLGDQGAAKLVFKYLFDYNDLTVFEQKVLKRISPFMTWTRKNIPLQLETLAKNPGRFSRVQQVRSEVERQAGPVENGPVPDYIADQGGFKVPGGLPFGLGKEGVATPDLPYRSAFQAVQPLAALLKGAVKGEADQQALLDLVNNNTGGASGALWNVLSAGGLRKDAFTGAEYKPGQRVDSLLGKIDPVVLKALESALPPLQRSKTFAPQSAADEKNQARRLLSLLTGIGVTPLNDSTKTTALYDMLEKLQAQQQTIKDTGGKIPDVKDVPGYVRPGSKRGWQP